MAQVTVSLAIVAGIFAFAVPKFAHYDDVWRSVGDMTWLEITSLVLVGALNIVTYWPMMMASMPGLTLAQAAVSNQASTSVANTLPGGGWIATGLNYSMYRSWGFTNTDIGLTTIITAIWNTFVKLGMPVIALAAIAITGRASAALIIPTVIGIAVLVGAAGVFAGMLWRKSMARTIGEGLGRAATSVRKWFGKSKVDWGDAAVRFRTQTIGLVAKRWPALTLFAVLSHVALYLVLLLALRHVGVTGQEVTWAQVLSVFAFVRLISVLPITPGGVGLIELGYIGGLYVAGRTHAAVPLDVFKAQVAGAVLMFRLVTFALQIPLGAIAYVIWQRKRSWRKPVPDPFADPMIAAPTFG
jgi:putative heme transporter